MEDNGNAVIATVLRNENVQDFTIQYERDSGTVSTTTLSGSAGSSEKVTDSVLSNSVEVYGSNFGNGVAAPIQNGDTIDLQNTNFNSFNIVEGDTTSDSDVNYDTSDIQSDWIVTDAGTGIIEYTSSTDLQNVRVDYDYESSTDPLTEVRVIANMPDGQSEVLTSTEVNK